MLIFHVFHFQEFFQFHPEINSNFQLWDQALDIKNKNESQ